MCFLIQPKNCNARPINKFGNYGLGGLLHSVMELGSWTFSYSSCAVILLTSCHRMF